VKYKYLECFCSSVEHTLRLSYIEDEPDELYVELQLIYYDGIFARVWAAIKYVLGYSSQSGHFDCIGLDRAEVEKLRDELNMFLVKGDV